MRILQQDRILLRGEAPETVCVRQQNKLYLTFHQNGGEYIPTTVERLSFHSLIFLFLGGLRCQGVSGFGACVWHLCYWRATWQLRSRPSLSLCEYWAVLLRRGGVIQCPAADRCGVVGDICSSTAKSPHHMVLFMHNLLHIPAMWKKKPRYTQTLSKWQQRKYNYRKHIHHQPCLEPTVACAACEPELVDGPLVGPFLSMIAAEPWSPHGTFNHRVFLTLSESHWGVQTVSWYPCGHWTGRQRQLSMLCAQVEAQPSEAVELVFTVGLWGGWQHFWFAG